MPTMAEGEIMTTVYQIASDLVISKHIVFGWSACYELEDKQTWVAFKDMPNSDLKYIKAKMPTEAIDMEGLEKALDEAIFSTLIDHHLQSSVKCVVECSEIQKKIIKLEQQKDLYQMRSSWELAIAMFLKMAGYCNANWEGGKDWEKALPQFVLMLKKENNVLIYSNPYGIKIAYFDLTTMKGKSVYSQDKEDIQYKDAYDWAVNTMQRSL